MTQLKNAESEGIKNYIYAVRSYAGNKENAINDIVPKCKKKNREM